MTPPSSDRRIRAAPPYRISPEYERRFTTRALFIGIAGLAFVLTTFGLSLSFTRDILRDQDLWARGVPGSTVEAFGREQADRGFFRAYDLRVRFLDRDGAQREGASSFHALGIGIREWVPPEVRHDPEAPSRFVLSWAIDVLGQRKAFAAFFAVIGGIGGALWTRAMKRNRRERRVLEACARRGRETTLRVLKQTPMAVHGRVTTIYRLEGRTPEGESFEMSFEDAMGAPLFADAERGTLVALVAPEYPEDPVVLMEGYLPFDIRQRGSRSDGDRPSGSSGARPRSDGAA